MEHISEQLGKKEIKKPDNLVSKVSKAILESEAVLFHDQLDDTYLAPFGDGTKVIKIRSKPLRKWLSYFGKLSLGKPLPNNAMTDVINDLEGEAQHKGRKRDLAVRITRQDDALWYDLGKASVRIRPNHWTVEYKPPILFKRFSHQLRQVEPKEGGNLDLLDDVLPTSMNEEQRILFKISLVTGLLPHIPQTVDVIFGDHGSAKSTLTKIKKSLLDPSHITELTPPTSLNEMIQLLAHHWYLPLGNLTGMPVWMSDTISRASTGSAFSKRELYSDDDDVIYTFTRVIGLNGINLVAEKADLLDRALLLGDLERIPEDKRVEEDRLWSLFEERKPFILGAMFTALGKAMAIQPTVQLARIPRMADFTRWGCAVAEAIGISQERFLDIYFANISNQHQEALQSSPIATTLVQFMSERAAWHGTPSELLNLLQPIAEDLCIDTHRLFPKNSAWVWKRIKEIRINLAQKGIHAFQNRTEDERLISLTKIADGTYAITYGVERGGIQESQARLGWRPWNKLVSASTKIG